MKSIVLLLLGLSLVFSQTNTCFKTCVQGDGTCPTNSECAFFTNDHYGCVCVRDTVARCDVDQFQCVAVNNTTPTGCGPYFPNGCPELSQCVTITTDGGVRSICVCRDGYVMQEGRCVYNCPPNSHSVATTNSITCQCNDGYEPDPFVTVFQCRLIQNTQTCSPDRCPTGFTCHITQTGGIECVPNNVDPRCGYDFRCPDNQVCLQTTAGPKCFCQQGRSGANCDATACWTPLDDAGNPIGPLGCWWTDGSAECVPYPDSTRPPFCVCRTGFTGLECNIRDDLCLNVQCTTIEHTHCERGHCVCDVGFLPVRNADGTDGFHCNRIQPPENCEQYAVDCQGNRICVSLTNSDNVTNPDDLRCGCPDIFGGHDCNKPSCLSDADCVFSQTSMAFCVRSTRPDVQSFCACREGFTGPRCEDPVTCDRTVCPDGTRYDCNNEGGCGCVPGREGPDCTVDNSTQICIILHIYLRAGTQYTAEQVRNRLAGFLRTDRLNIRVEGPNRRNDGRIEFTVHICGDRNIDEDAVRQNLEDTVSNGGDDNGLGIEAVGDIPDSSFVDDNSGASTLAVSAIVAIATIANL